MTIEQKLEIIKEVLETGKSGQHFIEIDVNNRTEYLSICIFNCTGSSIKDCEEVFYMDNPNQRQRLDHWLEVIRLEQKHES